MSERYSRFWATFYTIMMMMLLVETIYWANEGEAGWSALLGACTALEFASLVVELRKD